MDAVAAVAHTTFVTAGLAVAYTVLIAVEAKKGRRFGGRFRRRLDAAVIALLKRTGKDAAYVAMLYERGSDEVEKDLIDPMTKPLIETQQRYTALKTGERTIRRVGLTKISPHLQKLLRRNKKAGRKRRMRFQRRLKRMQQQMLQKDTMPQQ